MEKVKELEKNLVDVGLSDKEKAIYLGLFEMGGRGFPSAIAKKVGLNRSTTYKLLTTLAIKGLVSDIEKNKKVFYQLNKPDRLVGFVEQQSKEIGRRLENIQRISPELQKMFSNLSQSPRVLFYEGHKEVAEIYKDMTRHKNYEMLAFFNAKYVETFWSEKDLNDWIKMREQKQIRMRAILPDNEINRNYANKVYGNINKRYFPTIRYVSESIFPFDVEITMYGKDKVAIFKLNKETIDQQMIGVVIEDTLIHQMMKMIFELSWTGAENIRSKEKNIDHATFWKKANKKAI